MIILMKMMIVVTMMIVMTMPIPRADVSLRAKDSMKEMLPTLTKKILVSI